MHYLVVYRKPDGKLLHFKSFEEEDQRRALAAGSALKRRNAGRDELETALLHADSVDQLKKECPQYFANAGVHVDPGHCYETYAFRDFALSCDNSNHSSWSDSSWGDSPDMHYDPEWKLYWRE
jgi:hypothetical protein